MLDLSSDEDDLISTELLLSSSLIPKSTILGLKSKEKDVGRLSAPIAKSERTLSAERQSSNISKQPSPIVNNRKSPPQAVNPGRPSPVIPPPKTSDLVPIPAPIRNPPKRQHLDHDGSSSPLSSNHLQRSTSATSFMEDLLGKTSKHFDQASHYHEKLARLIDEYQQSANRTSQIMASIQNTLAEIHTANTSGSEQIVDYIRQIPQVISESAEPAKNSAVRVIELSGLQRLSTAASKPAVIKNTEPYVRTILRDITMDSRNKVFSKKPRSLIFNTENSAFEDLMTTSSLNGRLYFWSVDKKQVLDNILLGDHMSLKTAYAEQMCWNSNGTALALGFMNADVDESGVDHTNEPPINSQYASSPCQLSIMHMGNGSIGKIYESHMKPHDKRGVFVIGNVNSNETPAEHSHFVTGGLDKQLVLWDIPDDPMGPGATFVLHRKHTSSIQAVHYVKQNNTLLSSGMDTRICEFSLHNNTMLRENRTENRISHFLGTASNPNLVMASVCAMSSQLRIIDIRTGPSVPAKNMDTAGWNHVAVLGWAESANMSRYCRPGWHNNGHIVAFGSCSPIIGGPGINLWDLRYLKEARDVTSPTAANAMGMGTVSGCIQPMQFIETSRKVVQTEFAPAHPNSLVALYSSDALSFVDYSLA